MNQFLDAALGYAQRGWRVFPLHGIVNGACTCGRRDCGSVGKHPLVRRGLHEATTDLRQIEKWWQRWQSANIGIATGAESGIVVVDIDLGHRTNRTQCSSGDGTQDQSHDSPFDSLARLLERGLSPTLTGLTGGGGLHLIYGCGDDSLGNSAGRLPGIDGELPGIDLRGNGGYIVAPPSAHRSGEPYRWLDPNRVPAAAPVWLKQPKRSCADIGDVAPVELEGDGTSYGLAILNSELGRLRAAQVGIRNHELNRCAFILAQLVAGGELLESVVRSLLLTTAMSTGLYGPEILQTINSAFTAGTRSPRVAPHRIEGSGRR